MKRLMTVLLLLIIASSAGAQPCPTWPEDPTPDATIVVDGSLWDPQGDSFTIMFDMFIPEGQNFLNTNVLLRKGTSATFSKSGDNIDFTVIDDNDTPHVAESTFTFSNGVWFNLVGVLDRTSEEVRFYISGVLQDTVVYSGNPVRDSSLNDLCFGCLDAITGTFVGQICEIFLFDAPLTQGQIISAQFDPSIRESLLAYWPGVVDETQSPRDLIDFGPDSRVYHPSPWAGDLSSSIVVE